MCAAVLSRCQEAVDSLGGVQQLLPPVQLGGVRGLPGEVLRHGPGGELRLAHVAEVAREVDSLALHQRGQQRHVGRLPPTGGQGEADPVQLTSQHLTAVLGLGPATDGGS